MSLWRWMNLAMPLLLISPLALAACGPALPEPGAVGAPAQPAAAAALATVRTRAWQIDPGHKDLGLYDVTRADGSLFGRVLSVRVTNTVGGALYEERTEYWSLSGDASAIAGEPSLRFSGKELTWEELGENDFPKPEALAVFASPEQIEFQAMQPGPVEALCSNDAERNVCLDLAIAYDAEKGRWSGALNWYNSGPPVEDGLLIHHQPPTVLARTSRPQAEEWAFGRGEPVVPNAP